MIGIPSSGYEPRHAEVGIVFFRNVDQLDHAIGEVRIAIFDVSDNVDEGFADIDDLLVEIPMVAVRDNDLDDVFVDRAETTLGSTVAFPRTHRSQGLTGKHDEFTYQSGISGQRTNPCEHSGSVESKR